MARGGIRHGAPLAGTRPRGGWTWAGIRRLDGPTAARLVLARRQPIRLCVPGGGEVPAILADDPLGPEHEFEITDDGPPSFH